MPCSVETAQCSASPGLTTTSIGAAGGVRVSHVRAAVAADLDVRRLGVDGDDQVAGDLELVVVGLRALDGRPASRRGREERISPRFSGRSPSCGWPDASRSPVPAKRTTRLPETVPSPCGVLSLPVRRSASFAPGRDAEERRAGADHDRAVARVDRDRVDRGARAVAGAAAASQTAAGGSSVGASVGAASGAAARRRPLGASLAAAARRAPGRGDHARARERAGQGAQSNLARPAAISIAPSRWPAKRGSA